MALSGSLTLAAFAVLGVVLLIVAYRTHWVDRLAHRLEGPPQRHEQRARSHCRLVHPSAPSPLPRRDQGDCSLFNWEGGDDAA